MTLVHNNHIESHFPTECFTSLPHQDNCSNYACSQISVKFLMFVCFYVEELRQPRKCFKHCLVLIPGLYGAIIGLLIKTVDGVCVCLCLCTVCGVHESVFMYSLHLQCACVCVYIVSPTLTLDPCPSPRRAGSQPGPSGGWCPLPDSLSLRYGGSSYFFLQEMVSDWEQCVNSPVTLDKPARRPVTGTYGMFDRERGCEWH